MEACESLSDLQSDRCIDASQASCTTKQKLVELVDSLGMLPAPEPPRSDHYHS